jgi:hypothetical protein
MKKFITLALAGSLALIGGCKDFLDVNENPNAPQVVSPNLYLAPILHWVATSAQFDGRFVGRYNQEWTLPSASTTASTWDRMGYDPGSDNGGQLWRDVYWNIGQNLVDMMDKSRAESRWDLLGVGYTIKAWGWLMVTEMHGELIIKQAFDQTRFSFDYDSQEYAYQEISRLLDSAQVYLSRTDGAVDAAYMARGDKVYGGDRTKWLKFSWGLRAMALNHFSNKAAYKPLDVIAAVDKALASNADDALLQYTNASPDNADGNFLGWTRNNFRSYRQTNFVLNLMNGVSLGSPDPRLSRMLAPSPDGQYRGWDINSGISALPAAQLPNNFYGNVGTAGASAGPARYLFDDKSRFPIMTYAQLQFIKAEAAYKAGQTGTALQAYTNGISSHIDFVNARNLDNAQSPTQIAPAEKAAFLADPKIVPTAANLSLTQIMSQKYIAQWAWAHVEMWTDLRRYNYTAIDPQSGVQVFPGFTPPTNLYPDNSAKIVQRMRARYNSEYVWNRPGLDVIGGLALDFHTKPLWITQP